MKTKQLYFAGAMVVLATILLWLGAKPIMSAEIPVPPDIIYGEKNPLGATPFSHKSHVTEKKLACPDCHTKIFQMKKMAAAAQMKMKALNEGEFCGKCHDGKKAFATKEAKDCSRCHIKK